MSIFVQTGQIDPEKDYFSDLVGEGKRYATTKDAGRAIVEKDLYIKQIEDEKRKTLEDLHASRKEGELYDKLKTLFEKSPSTGSDTNTGGNGTTNTNTPPTVGMTPAELDEYFNRRIQETEQSRREAENENVVKAKLVETFGTNYTARLNEEAAKLSMTPAQLETVAKTNPNAFFRLVGLEAKAPVQQFHVPPRNAVESSTFKLNAPKDRTETYYAELRKADPVKYQSREIQNQEYMDAIRLGEAFFDKNN